MKIILNKLFSETHGQGPDLVLLHGWGLHSGIWQHIVPKLVSDFRVTVIDLPGFGRSNPLSDYSILNVIESLYYVAPKEAMWVGWSLGGLIAKKYSLTFPERVNKLICVASSPRFLKTTSWPGMKASVLQNFNEQLEVDYEATLLRFLLLQFNGMILDKNKIRWLNQIIFLYGRPKIKALNAGLSILKNEDLRLDMGNIKCPILYLFGKLDTFVPAKLSEKLEKLQPSVRSIIFPKASHALFLSHEKEFIEEVRRFAYE